MPITDEERKQYGSFLVDIAKELGSLQVDFGQTLWHYTTGTALLAIVSSGQLYATQVGCLNDSTEIRYATRLLREAFLNLQTDQALEEVERGFLAEFIKDSTQETVVPPNASSKWFVTCFTQQRDDLSQWRAYSGGENGYAIGFLAGGFFELGSRHNIARVNYDSNLHRSI